MKLALDTNVVLDVIAKREPFVQSSASVFYQIECGNHSGILCATTFTTLSYLLRKSAPGPKANQHLGLLLSLFDVAPVTRSVLSAAIASGQRDFKDAVLAHAAQLAGADLIITRNTKDFVGAPLPVATPFEWLARA